MNIKRPLLNILRLLFRSLAALAAGYLLAALLLSLLGTHPVAVECPQRAPVYVSTNGVHLFLVLPVDLLADTLRGVLPVAPGTRYVSFGWGDREFYRSTPRWRDLRFGTAFRALFCRTPAAMHVTVLGAVSADWKEVALCPAQVAALNAFLSASFRRDASGRLLPVVAEGYSANDHFFEAHGHYTCFRTSNVWVNEALKQAGVPTALWSPFDAGVWYHLE